MVKLTLLSIVAIVLTTQAACASSGADATTPRLRRLDLPVIQSIRIEENGASSPAERGAREECRSFVLDARDVREYLEKAGQVAEHDYFHMLDWSPCHASGKVVFSDGLTGSWGIQQLRAGSLTLSDGRRIYLYCPDCKAKPFLPR